ncbi:heparinase II/III family protein [Siccirubricoccus deserti]
MEWLWRVTDPETGATPRLGHQDSSAFADLSLAGPNDTRPSLERAARLLAGRSAGLRDDAGCAWLGLAKAPPLPAPPARWAGGGLMAWHAGGARAFLRTGPIRFRPGHADLLHLDLWDGPLNLLRDGGTGAYNPAAGWWHAHLGGTAGHNTVEFDGADQMPRVSRFLFARWPRTGALPDGAWLRDCRGNRQDRVIRVEGRRWLVEDRLSGPFRQVALRWRLAPAEWRATWMAPKARLPGCASPRTRRSTAGWSRGGEPRLRRDARSSRSGCTLPRAASSHRKRNPATESSTG